MLCKCFDRRFSPKKAEKNEVERKPSKWADDLYEKYSPWLEPFFSFNQLKITRRS